MATIAFTGDIAFSKYFADGWKRDDLIADDVVEFLSTTDYTVPNIEAPITEGTIQSTRALNHTNPPGCMDWLRKINANVWNLSNNHMYDCQAEGLVDTLEFAAKNGCLTVGAGRNADEAMQPVILDVAGGIGILSVCYHNAKEFLRASDTKPGCILWDEFDRISQTIRRVKEQCRWCIVISHGGSEFSSLPLPFVRERYLRFLDFGADIVVGHHPHVMQNYETVGNKIIFYSLGNFIFDTDYQRAQPYSEYGMLVKFHFTEQDFTWEKCPIFIDRKANRVVSCECPAIFCDIQPKAYRRLWPLMVHVFTANSRRASLFLNKKYESYNEWKWFRSSASWQGFIPAVRLVWGRFVYYLGFWKRGDTALVEYLKKG